MASVLALSVVITASVLALNVVNTKSTALVV